MEIRIPIEDVEKELRQQMGLLRPSDDVFALTDFCLGFNAFLAAARPSDDHIEHFLVCLSTLL